MKSSNISQVVEIRIYLLCFLLAAPVIAIISRDTGAAVLAMSIVIYTGVSLMCEKCPYCSYRLVGPILNTYVGFFVKVVFGGVCNNCGKRLS